ncbi:hypothetical protein BDV26DRAFT_256387 [Aspergillus bertholletiae]|uniref:Uncharacterized protein n=1 Tax=Aspergillus bertholletiae TaxID=1226010 RepID=A0A5N7BGF1_9EURO|nr:hypothetical protein BDV26DRAFT_256387 [Aspergillus bertholletiae]
MYMQDRDILNITKSKPGTWTDSSRETRMRSSRVPNTDYAPQTKICRALYSSF